MRIISILTITTLLLVSCAQPAEVYTTQKTATYIASEEFAKLNMPFSEAVIYGDMIYASGQVGEIGFTTEGVIVEGGIGPETRQAMLNIKRVLEQNGSSLDNIIKCTCMLADINEWAEMSKAYMTFFPNHQPARSAFATTGLALGARVEIECMAYLNK
jgi:reactive intermediate/imine deaminase